MFTFLYVSSLSLKSPDRGEITRFTITVTVAISITVTNSAPWRSFSYWLIFIKDNFNKLFIDADLTQNTLKARKEKNKVTVVNVVNVIRMGKVEKAERRLVKE